MTSGVNGGTSWGEREGDRDNEREGCKATGLQEAEEKIHVPTLRQVLKVGREKQGTCRSEYDDRLLFHY